LQRTIAPREHGAMRLAVLACVVWLVSSSTFAQDADAAHARELFTHGLSAARAEHWVEARDAFAASLAIAERPSTLLNLAGAQVQTGQLVEGAASYRRFLEIATEARDVAHRGEAESALAAVEARVPHVTIRVDGLSAGDEVRLDDAIVMPAALGASTALDPGAHDVVVMRAGRSIARQRFQLAEGANDEIELAVSEVAVASATEAARTAPMDEAIAAPVVEPPPSDDTPLWIGVGVGVGVAVAVGVILAVVFATQDQQPALYHGNFGDGVLRF
jgi:hypothetical protein